MNNEISIIPREFFRLDRALYLTPLSYTVILGMLMTRWAWEAEGQYAGHVHMRLDRCHFLRTKWKSHLGPYRISMVELDNGRLEISDSTSEFRVVCEGIHVVENENVSVYYRNLRHAGG